MTWTSVTVGSGSNMDVYVERPERSRAPGVIVLQELFGVNAHIRDVARRVAGLGYVAVAPDLFHRTATRFEGPYDNLPVSMAHARKMTPDGIQADLRAAYEWLGHDEQADGECVAAWGFCMGGRVALLADAILPLRAAVSFYGGVTDALLPQLPKLSGPVLLAWGGLDKHLGAVAQRPACGRAEGGQEAVRGRGVQRRRPRLLL